MFLLEFLFCRTGFVIACIGSAVGMEIVSGWMYAVSIYICPLGAMLAGIMFFWVAGKDVAVDAVTGEEKRKLEAGLFPLESMCWFQLRLLHLWQAR